jgi:hypothetical protein
MNRITWPYNQQYASIAPHDCLNAIVRPVAAVIWLLPLLLPLLPLLPLPPLLPLLLPLLLPPLLKSSSNCDTAVMYRLQYCAAVSKQRLLSLRSSSSCCWMHCKLVIDGDAGSDGDLIFQARNAKKN